MILDANNAMAVLASFHHWKVQVENHGAGERRHSCTILHNGRRVTAYRTMPLDAVKAAIDKLNAPRVRAKREKAAPVLRLAGGGR